MGTLSWLVSLFYFVVASFVKVIPCLSSSGRFSRVVVKLDGIGDMVISSAVLGAVLRKPTEAESDCAMALVCSKECEGLAACLYPGIRIISVDLQLMRRSFFYRLRTYFSMTRLVADQIVHLTFSRSFNDAELVTFCLHSRSKIAPQDDLANKGWIQNRISKSFYSELLVNQSRGDEYSRYRQLGACLNCIEFGNPLAEAIEKVPSVRVPDGYFVIFPGASFGLKRWPIEYFLRLANDMQGQTGLVPCWVGGSFDLREIPELRDELPGISFVGKTHLIESIKIISQACFVVTNDSSAAHFAKTLNVSLVVLVGGGHFGRFISEVSTDRQLSFYHKMSCFGCGWQCHLVDARDQSAPCLAQIPYAPVLKACVGLTTRA